MDNDDISKFLGACRKFIKKHKISCADDIYQSDDVVIASPEMVEKICKLVGYYDHDTGEIKRM